MIIYLYGPDTYRRNQVLRETIKNNYEKKHSGLTVREFSFELEDALENLTTFLTSGSLFDSTKLAILTEPEKAKPKALANLLNEYADDKNKTIVVVADKKLTKEFAFLLEKPCKAQEFSPLDRPHMLSFLKKEAEQLGFLNIDAKILNTLVDAYGEDTWSAMTEMESIAQGKKFEAPQAIPAFFPLIQGVKGSGSVSRQLGALHQLLEHHDVPMVFNMIASMSDASTKIQMADYDVAIKSGKLDYPEALLDFVLSRT
ncbi:MAG: hypothetical protein Q7R62_01325 [bacterium]|nr:hypothetical protein [bacterium]